MKYIKLFESNTKFKGHKYGPKNGGEVDIGLDINEINDYFLELEDAGWKINYSQLDNKGVPYRHSIETNIFDIVSPSTTKSDKIKEIFKDSKSDELINNGYRYLYYFWIQKNDKEILNDKFFIMSRPAMDTNVSHSPSQEIINSNIDKMIKESIFVGKSIKNIESRLEERGLKAFFYVKDIYHIKVSILIK